MAVSKQFSEDFNKSYTSGVKKSRTRTQRDKQIRVHTQGERTRDVEKNQRQFPADQSTLRTTPHLRPDLGSAEDFDDLTQSNSGPQNFETFSKNKNVPASMTYLKKHSPLDHIPPSKNFQSDDGRTQTTKLGNLQNHMSQQIHHEDFGHPKNQQLAMILDENESDENDSEPNFYKLKNQTHTDANQPIVIRRQKSNQKQPNFEPLYNNNETLNKDLGHSTRKMVPLGKNMVYSKVPEEDIQANFDVGRAKVQTNMTYSNKLIHSRPFRRVLGEGGNGKWDRVSRNGNSGRIGQRGQGNYAGTPESDLQGSDSNMRFH